MEKNIRGYELTVIVDVEGEEKKQKELLEKITDWIKKAAGETVKKEEWGKKELAYPLEKKNEGLYWFFQFKLEPGKLGEVKEKLRREESILRFLLIKIAPEARSLERRRN